MFIDNVTSAYTNFKRDRQTFVIFLLCIPYSLVLLSVVAVKQRARVREIIRINYKCEIMGPSLSQRIRNKDRHLVYSDEGAYITYSYAYTLINRCIIYTKDDYTKCPLTGRKKKNRETILFAV